MLRVLGHLMQGSYICVHYDNMAVVQVVQSSKTRDDFLALCLRNICLLTSKNDIDLQIRHVEGSMNPIADALSHLPTGNKNFKAKIHELGDNLHWHNVEEQHFILDLFI